MSAPKINRKIIIYTPTGKVIANWMTQDSAKLYADNHYPEWLSIRLIQQKEGAALPLFESEIYHV